MRVARFMMATALGGMVVPTGLMAQRPRPVATAPLAVRESLDRAMPETLARFRIPAASIARIRHGRIDLVATYGQRDATHPATPATLFNIASLTKPLAAQIALRLVDSGDFTLDTRMSDVWTDPDVLNDPRVALLTPRIMLSHKTGFANWRRQTSGRLTFAFTPGARYGYSGEGYEYLRRWMEAQSGVRLDVAAQTQLFSPARMSETAFVATPRVVQRAAQPSVDGRFVAPDFVEVPSAADNVHSSARDYARFLVWLMQGGGLTPALSKAQLSIHADQTEELCNPAQPDHCPDAAGFGLGWQVIKLGRKTFLMHTGSDEGEFSFAYWSPDKREGAVILTNSNRGSEAVLAAIDLLRFDPDYAAFLKALAAK